MKINRNYTNVKLTSMLTFQGKYFLGNVFFGSIQSNGLFTTATFHSNIKFYCTVVSEKKQL